MMLGASLVTATGLTAATLHMFNHALAKGGLFLAIAAIAIVAAGCRLSDIAGLARRMPWTFAALVVAGLSLIGIPGTAGFISKWYLINAALELETGGVALVALILVSSLMAVVYVWRIVEAAYFGEPGEQPTASVPPALVVILWAVAIANIGFGIAPELPLSLSAAAADILLGHVQ
jgi:multicomponent Na+:H+ antiporter subunit D